VRPRSRAVAVWLWSVRRSACRDAVWHDKWFEIYDMVVIVLSNQGENGHLFDTCQSLLCSPAATREYSKNAHSDKISH